MSSSVEKIKERLSIADVISSYVKIEKAGASYKGACPFHNEKTPSFFVSPDRGTYYCFGCGAKGDMFTFVQEFEGVEFMQALKNLAGKAGVELVHERSEEKDSRDVLFHTVEVATEFFESQLGAHLPAQQYLASRGLKPETISTWRVGFAPLEWHSASVHLTQKKIAESDMLATGIIKRNESNTGNRYYDVFRGRIMFPIFDGSGRPVAFSGRILVDDDKSPKYLNSPATVLFNKSEVLYGFDRAKTQIRKLNYSIMVEGQMDLLLSHQAGFSNTVASSGTALTERHLRLLQRLSSRIMFAFDSDSAGFKATKRSAELALQIGMEVKVVVMPAGEDPASLVLKDANLWKMALKNAKHIIDFYTDALIFRNKDARVLSREIRSEVLPFVLSVESKTEQAHFVKSIAEKAGLKEDALWDDIRSIQKSNTGTNTGTVGAPAQISREAGRVLSSRLQGIERRIVSVIFWQESKKESAELVEHIRKRLREMLGPEDAKGLEEALSAEREKLIFEAEQYYERSDSFEKDAEELFINLEEETLRTALSKKMADLHKAETVKNTAQVKEFLDQCQAITNKLEALRRK